MIIQIVAVDSKNGIGKQGEGMPWHFPKDLEWFKFHTSGSICVMGRTTFNTLPGTLPNRETWVLTRTPEDYDNTENVKYMTLNYAMSSFSDCRREIYICGGASIYKQTLDITDEIIISRLPISNEESGCDVFYPGVPENFKHISSFESNNINFQKWINK